MFPANQNDFGADSSQSPCHAGLVYKDSSPLITGAEGVFIYSAFGAKTLVLFQEKWFPEVIRVANDSGNHTVFVCLRLFVAF